MVDLGAIGSSLGGLALKWATTGFFWVFVVIVMLFCAWVFLFFRKRKRLRYPVGEFIDIGNHKVALFIDAHGAGWFGKKTIVFGLIDVGKEKVLKHKDGRIIDQASTEDLHDINGKRGFLVMRKHDDPKVLVPMNRFLLSEQSRKLLGAIASADFRDTANNIVDLAKEETAGKWDKLLPYLALGAIVVFFVIAVIFASQTFNKSIETAKDLLLQAGDKILDASTQVHSNTIPSGAP